MIDPPASPIAAEPEPTPSPSFRPEPTIIKPTRGWSGLNLGELWAFRGLAKVLVIRNLQGRYRQMALGPLWIVLQPLANMVLFSIVFGRVAQLPSEGVPYAIFSYTALLPWTYFSKAASEGANSLVSNMRLMTKLYFPRMIAPLASSLAAVVDFLISMIILAGLLIYFRVAPSWGLLCLPLFLLLAGVCALTVALWASALQVRFRDTQYVLGYLLQAWMYASPVAYSSTLVPERFRFLYELNPLFWVVEGFRWALLGKDFQLGLSFLVSLALTVLGLFLGAMAFRRAERTIVDIL